MSASHADDTGFARTPVPPYYAVIFTSTRTTVNDGYGAMADRMVEYEHFETRVAKEERAYDGPRLPQASPPGDVYVSPTSATTIGRRAK